VLSILKPDGAVGGEIALHGLAGVEENAGADGEVLEETEVDDAAGRFAVVEEAQLIEFEVVDGKALGVGGVEGETDFVDGEGEAVRLVGLRGRAGWLACEQGQ
jgi:hypothetical protein